MDIEKPVGKITYNKMLFFSIIKKSVQICFLDGVSGGKDVYFQINSGSYTIDNKDAFVMSPDLEIDWGGKYAGYKDYSYEIVNGSYNSCNGTYTLTFKIFCTLGSFGNYDFVFTPAE